MFSTKLFRSILTAALVGTFSLTGCAGDETEDNTGTGDEQNVSQAAGVFETFTGMDGQHYFALLAGNGEKVLRSEGYVSKSGMKNGIESVKNNGVDVENFEVLEATDGEWYFNLKAKNHQIIGTSEMYVSKSNAERAVETVNRLVVQAVRVEAAETGGAHFEIFKGTDSQYYFRMRAANGEIVLASEGYKSKSGAKNGIESVRNNGKELEQFEIVEAQNGQHYFRLEAKNYQIIARGELYSSLQGAEQGVETVMGLLQSEKVADAE